MKKAIRTGLIGFLILAGCSSQPAQVGIKTPDSGFGALQISVEGAPRTTQARLTDVDHVLFTLESAKAAPSTRTLAYVNGTPAAGSVTFNDLWPGAATVSAKVYGVNPIRTQGLHTQAELAVIGSATTTATVVSGQVTQVPMSIKLDSTQTQAGGLSINLTLQPGDENLIPLP